jgi:hypothetical protein
MARSSTTSSRMERNGVSDTSRKENRSRIPVPSILKSLGPLEKLSSRDLSDSTATALTVASNFSEYDEEQDVFVGEVPGAHGDLPIQWGRENFSSHPVIEEGEYEYGTYDDDYLVPLSDAPTRNLLLDETRTNPKRREMLMDDFERKIREELLNVDDRSCADSTTDEESGEEDYEYLRSSSPHSF